MIMILLILYNLITGMTFVHGMTLFKHQDQKLAYIRDAFTNEGAWDYTLSQSSSPVRLAYRQLTTVRKIPDEFQPASDFTNHLIAYIKDNNLNTSTKFTVLYNSQEDVTFTGSTDGTLYITQEEIDDTQEIDYTPVYTSTHVYKCHSSSITSIHRVADNWLAISGGNEITFHPTNSQYNTVRVSIKKIGSIETIHMDKGTLIVTEKKRKRGNYEDHFEIIQFGVYPYDKLIYNILRGYERQAIEELDVLAKIVISEDFHNTNSAISKKRIQEATALSEQETVIYNNLPEFIIEMIARIKTKKRT